MANVDSATALSALLNSSAAAQAITVNQRALIDKILARYAAEWTVFRELLQNADDAGATECHLRFESQRYQQYKQRKASAGNQLTPSASAPSSSNSAPPLEPLSPSSSSSEPRDSHPGQPPLLNLSDNLHSWTFANDGMPFRDEDWARLRRIAEGNPDPERIGAFGVGYYSVFSICENPMVQSGGEVMGFFWDNDSLYTKRAPIPSASDKEDQTKDSSLREDRWTIPAPAPELSSAGRPWTTFLLPLREPAPLPGHPLNLARFLATSLTFTARVRRIALHWDDRVLCEFEKSIDGQSLQSSADNLQAANGATDLAIPSNLNLISPGRMMKVTRLTSSRIQINALHHPVLLADAKATELESQRKRAKEAEQAQKSGISAGAAVVANLFNFGNTTPSSGSESKRSAISNFFGFGKKSSGAPAPIPAPAPVVQTQPIPPTPPNPSLIDPVEQIRKISQRDAKPVNTIVLFRIATAHLDVTADSAFIKEIERSTKKPPPTRTAFSVVFADRDEVKRSRGEVETANSGLSNEKKTAITDESTDTSDVEKIKIPTALSQKDERKLTNRHLFGTLLPWLSGDDSGDDASTNAVAKASIRRGTVGEDDAVARMAREQQGHVFIGFRTHQTTGFAGHLAARFIPTVERESLDFIDKYCRSWNEELLAMGGYLIRALYEHEMTLLGQIWDRHFKSTSNRPLDSDVKGKETAEDLSDRALHLLRFFTIRTSHPSGKVAEILQERFFAVSAERLSNPGRPFKFLQSAPTDADRAVRIMSTCGVWPSSRVRLPNDILTPFIKRLPMLPSAHVTKAAEFVRTCTSRGLLMDVQMPDVFTELEQRTLDVDEMKACLKWYIMVANHPDYNPNLLSQLLGSAVLAIAGETSKEGDQSDSKPPEEVTPRIQPLKDVRTYLNSQRIPTGFPVPASCLAYEVSKNFRAEDLSRVFHWKELSVSQWIRHLVDISTDSSKVDENIQLSPTFAEKAFTVLARAWGNIAAAQQVDVTQSLQGIPCVPTRNGMQKPQQAYFPSVSLFDDLPVVAYPGGANVVKGNFEKVLVALGVRKHVELQLIFTRLVAAGDWSHVELVTYLAANQSTLTADEKAKLKVTAMFACDGQAAEKSADGKTKIKRYRANQLYEPVPALRALGLDLLDWTKPAAASDKAEGETTEVSRATTARAWRPTSEEAKFLFDTLGLLRHPPLSVLLAKAAEPGTTKEAAAMRARALTYLREKWDSVYAPLYTVEEASKYKFVPCIANKSDAKDAKKAEPAALLRHPTQVFTNPAAAVLGFDVVDSSILSDVDAARFKLAQNPQSHIIIETMLQKITNDKDQARIIFEYMSSVSTFTSNQYHFLRDKTFIPATKKVDGEEKTSLTAPILAFFGNARVTSLSYKDVFTFIDFGDKAAVFLRNCGVADEPTIEEVAQKLVRDPRLFYKLSGSSDNYLDILRQIATNWNRISSRLKNEMRSSAFLLGVKRIPKASPGKDEKEKRADAIPNIMDEEIDSEQGLLTYDLLIPSQVIIVDDSSSHMIFAGSAFFAPHDDILELNLYLPLGCPKLSALVEERQSIAGTVETQSTVADQVKAQILERTPLYFFEQRGSNRAQFSRDFDWLKRHLNVYTVQGRGLVRTRTFRHGNVTERQSQSTSALAEIQDRALRLFIAGKESDLDWFEIAAAINRNISRAQQLGDILLYQSLLQTPLRDLKRRGIAVDRIIEQKEAEKKAADRRMREAQEAAQAERKAEQERAQELQKQLAQRPSQTGVEGSGSGAYGPELEKRGREFADAAAAAASAVAKFQSGKGLFNKLGNRFRNGSSELSSYASGTSSISGMPHSPNGPEMNPIAAAGRSGGNGQGPGEVKDMDGHSSGPEPTPLDTIKQSVQSAIRASRPDGSEHIQSQVQKRPIKEAESSYCDVGIATDLRKVGNVLGMNVYLSPTFPHPAQTIAENRAAIERLITQVYRPVGEGVFKIRPGVLTVFCDSEGPTIAFNRGGAIFLNLRFYLHWHDAKVAAGQPGDAIISVFHSIAHELAHNLVSGHNAQHEYYTSVISEQHYLELGKLLQHVGAL
ncbi:hypothetical protein OC861_005681 [Tilletia horrida]|nr:hypothetical protein OC861_005681 [Tilletia horrida]